MWTSNHSKARTRWRAARDGFLRTRGLAAGSVVFGVLFGVAAGDVGMPEGQAMLMSAIVCAGAAQFAALEMWAAPLPISAIAVSTALICCRHVLMGLTLQPKFRRHTARTPYARLFFVTDVTWVLTRDADDDADPLAFFVASGAVMFGGWNLGTAIGLAAPHVLDAVTIASLGYAGVLFLAILMLMLIRGRDATALPWLVSAAVSVGLGAVVSSHAAVLIGVLAGAAVGLAIEHRRDA